MKTVSKELSKVYKEIIEEQNVYFGTLRRTLIKKYAKHSNLVYITVLRYPGFENDFTMKDFKYTCVIALLGFGITRKMNSVKIVREAGIPRRTWFRLKKKLAERRILVNIIGRGECFHPWIANRRRFKTISIGE